MIYEIATKQLIKKIYQNKSNFNHKNGDQIKKKTKTKWLGIKLKNKIQSEKRLKAK
jgi:hypothetical protein